jgi:hypothetical protein
LNFGDEPLELVSNLEFLLLEREEPVQSGGSLQTEQRILISRISIQKKQQFP